MLKRTLLFTGVLALLVYCSFDDHDQDYNARITRLETLMNLVLQRLNVNPNDTFSGPSEQIKALLMAGRKIEAIKIYREQTGIGLRGAKDYIDALERQMRGY